MKIEDNPMLSINVRVWRFFSVLLARDWRLYAFIGSICLMNAMQFVYLYRKWGEFAHQLLLNAFFAVAIFDSLLRTCLVTWNRERFERFMLELSVLYCEIECGDCLYAKTVLTAATAITRRISVLNLAASFSDIIATLLYPLFNANRVHPFGVAIPFVNMTATPVYEIFYVLQLPTPVVLSAMYMPFVSLLAAFAKFGVVTLKVLQHRLQQIKWDPSRSEAEAYAELVACIKYYNRIRRYVKDFNSLVTYIVCVEVLLFGVCICALLFCINIAQSISQIISIAMYICTMFFVLLAYYWHANELSLESMNVSLEAYSMQSWHCHSARFRTTLLIFIASTQQPLKIMVGNLYPMTLETFQSLLNVSYSYFTLLRGVLTTGGKP